jgi:SpoVK/Ycf46/Vps4 family AAA+-type ATPase
MKTQELVGTVESRREEGFREFRNPTFSWEDIAGYEGVVKVLKAIAQNVQSKGPSEGLSPTGIAFAGAPGTGKTRLGWTFAQQAGLELMQVPYPAIQSRFIHKAYKNLASRFDEAIRMSGEADHGVFMHFNPLEQFAPRDPSLEDCKVVCVLKDYMDRLAGNAHIIYGGEMARVETLDHMLLRHDRLEILVNLGVPDDATLGAIFKAEINKIRKMSKDAFADALDLSAIVAASSNAGYVSGLLREQRVLAQPGVIGGSELNGYKESVRLIAEGKVPALTYEGVFTRASISGMIDGLHQQRVWKAARTRDYEPITTQDILGEVAQRRGR